jgi:hypothetical protein
MVIAVMKKCGCGCGGQEEMGAWFFNIYGVHKRRFERQKHLTYPEGRFVWPKAMANEERAIPLYPRRGTSDYLTAYTGDGVLL